MAKDRSMESFCEIIIIKNLFLSSERQGDESEIHVTWTWVLLHSVLVLILVLLLLQTVPVGVHLMDL